MSAADEIAEMVRQGNKIEAIKQLREAGGMGLKEAKDFIERDASPEALEAVIRRAPRVSAGAGSAEVRRLAAEGQMIKAIKRLRSETGLGLKEAKDAVEAMRPVQAAKAAGTPGGGLPLKWVIAAAVALVICAALYALGVGS